MKKKTVAETITNYIALGKQYEDSAQKLPEPMKSSFFRMASQLYKAANDLEGQEYDDTEKP